MFSKLVDFYINIFLKHLFFVKSNLSRANDKNSHKDMIPFVKQLRYRVKKNVRSIRTQFMTFL